MAEADAVGVFLRLPKLGEVKTRLAADVGQPEALRLYRGWLAEAFAAAVAVRPRPLVVGYHTGATDEAGWADLASLAPADRWLPQPDGDLGDRLSALFADLLPRHRKAVAIGTDCPDLTAEHLAMAFAALERHPAALGPASDGGYWLIGLRADAGPPGPLFASIRWSGPETFRDQRARLESAGLAVALLPELADIDTGADLDRWRAAQEAGALPVAHG